MSNVAEEQAGELVCMPVVIKEQIHEPTVSHYKTVVNIIATYPTIHDVVITPKHSSSFRVLASKISIDSTGCND